MSRKRRNTSSAEPDSPPPARQPSANYTASSDLTRAHEQPQCDARSGQFGAFPGLGHDTAPFYGPARDGLDYLRMVRSEALTIPGLLSANGVPDDGYDDESNHEGFFGEDEAYVASVQHAPPRPPPVVEECSRAQLMYYKSLLVRYEALRAQLQLTPPLTSIQALPEATPISFPPLSRPARTKWDDCISQHAADAVQVACMDADSVLELIRLMTKRMRRYLRSCDASDVRRIGSWLWAMLAKCPDRGELGSEEVSVLRTLAQTTHATFHPSQARGDHADMEDGETSTEEEEEEEDAHGDADGDEAAKRGASGGSEGAAPHDLPAQIPSDAPSAGDDAKRSLQPPDPDSDPDRAHRVLLDMVVTVVGELYGQRDLLELRERWNTPYDTSSGE